MLRPIARLPIRPAYASQTLLRAGQRHQRRNITGPALKRRSWKSSFARWGIAAGGFYWYMNSDINLFDKEANEHGYVGGEILEKLEEGTLPTLETISATRRERQKATLSAASAPNSPPTSTQFNSSDPSSQISSKRDKPTESSSSPSSDTSSRNATASEAADGASPTSPEDLEEEASQQGAFNEETGEINWDCPCLGGMAHGPCGEQFRDAFSCFVYSKEEPKGVDCIDKFKNMQDCFRAHPDVYGSELTDDVDGDGEEQVEGATAAASTSTSTSTLASASADTATVEAAPPLETSPAPAPYSGVDIAKDRLPPNNLTANPSATPIEAASPSPSPAEKEDL